MLARIGKVATELLNYSNGIQSRLLTLQRIQAIGYSEQEAIFILDILEGEEPRLHTNEEIQKDRDAMISAGIMNPGEVLIVSTGIPAPELTGEEKPGDGYP